MKCGKNGLPMKRVTATVVVNCPSAEQTKRALWLVAMQHGGMVNVVIEDYAPPKKRIKHK